MTERVKSLTIRLKDNFREDDCNDLISAISLCRGVEKIEKEYYDLMKQPKEEDIYAKAQRLIPLTEWNKYHSWPPIGGLRHLVFHEKTNGFAKVTRRIGQRVLLSEPDFFKWVEEKNIGR